MFRFTLVFSLATVLVSSAASGLLAGNRQDRQADAYPVVAQLVLRDRTITIATSPAGYRYSIADRSGNLVANLTEAELAAQHPELFEQLKPAIANDGAGLLMLAPVEGR